MNKTVRWFTAVGCALLFVAFIGVEFKGTAVAKTVDRPIPAIGLTDLITGEEIPLDQVEGKYLLNIWGSWCVACLREHDALLQLQSSGVRLVGIAYMDSADSALKWLKEKGNPFSRSLLDSSGALAKPLGVKGAPETYLIDSSGFIRYKHVGIVKDEDVAEIIQRYRDIE